mmetsp:Transcript_19037/g.45751  ORF Transcript_19037/g.45751 Transcript_19037/m.45751 type:complete len:356 (-) Transcript_19037:1035-2102(-)
MMAGAGAPRPSTERKSITVGDGADRVWPMRTMKTAAVRTTTGAGGDLPWLTRMAIHVTVIGLKGHITLKGLKGPIASNGPKAGPGTVNGRNRARETATIITDAAPIVACGGLESGTASCPNRSRMRQAEARSMESMAAPRAMTAMEAICTRLAMGTKPTVSGAFTRPGARTSCRRSDSAVAAALAKWNTFHRSNSAVAAASVISNTFRRSNKALAAASVIQLAASLTRLLFRVLSENRHSCCQGRWWTCRPRAQRTRVQPTRMLRVTGRIILLFDQAASSQNSCSFNDHRLPDLLGPEANYHSSRPFQLRKRRRPSQRKRRPRTTTTITTTRTHTRSRRVQTRAFRALLGRRSRP